jgi:glucose/arabinose dehydrogenase
MRKGAFSTVTAVAAVAVSSGGVVSGAAPAASSPPMELVSLVTGLQKPVFVVPAPSHFPGRLYVVEQGGLLRIFDRGRLLPRPFLDLRHEVRAGGLTGLFSLAFDPRYASNGLFYVNYVGRDGAVYVSAFRAVHGVGALSSRRVLLRVATGTRDLYAHYGGQLAFGPDGRLYVSFGDGGDRETAQDPATLLGKLVRLNVALPKPVPEVVALGLRNPWRFSFDDKTGDLYIGDVGDTLLEEVDRLPRTFHGLANFGWPIWEGTHLARPIPATLAGRVTRPFLEYAHGRGRCNAITGGYVYRGTALPQLRDRYVFGDLCGGTWSVSVRGGDKRVEQLNPPGLLASFAEGWNTALYVVSLSGIIYQVESQS